MSMHYFFPNKTAKKNKRKKINEETFLNEYMKESFVTNY